MKSTYLALPLNSFWSFREFGTTDWLPATVPGTVHSDLMAAGKLADPYVGTNERDIQWVDKKAWEYRTEFDLPAEIKTFNHKGLRFHGLDTFARVYLNGKLVLEADNMFRTWNVGTDLLPTGNELRIEFDSPTGRGLALQAAHGLDLPASNDMAAMGGLGTKRVSPFVRKAPYHFGWDWGPRVATSGIWKSLEIWGRDQVHITDFALRVVSMEGQATAPTKARIEALVDLESDFSGIVHLELGWESSGLNRRVEVEPGTTSVSWMFELPFPRLWWCRGQGAQELYTFQLKLLGQDGAEHQQRTLRTGLRQVRLVREADEGPLGKGKSFTLELNGRPIFAKGGNHIPHDLLLPRVTEATYRHELESCAEAGFNLVRVWGGGIYESDVFYDLCDTLGLMVWQDFLFACSMYPGDEAFLASVAAEVNDNVRRLRNHPSLVLWCGNNEIDTAWQAYNPEGGWDGWKREFKPEQQKRIWADYEAVFHKLLPDLLADLQPELPYWPSSPMAELSGDAHSHAFDGATSGDQHYWGVWHKRAPFSTYKVVKARFMSEFGFQSFPEPKTLRAFATPDQWHLDSEVMKLHQKSAIGNQAIDDYLVRDYRRSPDFSTFAYLSQLLQAEAIRSAMEAHRRDRPYCMGSIYWQINDCWPGPSWSGIDSFGRWKALQYFLRESLADLTLSVNREDEAVELWVLNDSPADHLVTLEWQTWSLQGGAGVVQTLAVKIPAAASQRVQTLNWARLLAGAPSSGSFLHVRLLENGKHVGSRNAFALPIKDLELPPPAPVFHKKSVMDGVEVTVESPVFLKNLRLETDSEGFWEDNFFDVLPGVAKTVLFRSAHPGVLDLRWQVVTN